MDIFDKLSEKLRSTAHGFPHDDENLELELLRWIFTPKEAEMTFYLPAQGATAAEMSDAVGLSVDETETLLYEMMKHGQLTFRNTEKGKLYRVLPWIPGIYENQFYRIDKSDEEKANFAHIWEKYYPTYLSVASYGPANERVIPVGETIKSQTEVHRVEDVYRMIDEGVDIYVLPCVCRMEHELIHETPCEYPLEVCIFVANVQTVFEEWPPQRRKISKEEAKEIIRECEKLGLVHTTWNTNERTAYMICNCCSCCCTMLRGVADYGVMGLVENNFIARIDEKKCIGCGVCERKRCGFHAITHDARKYSVIAEKCIGCGVCAVSCPANAIELVRTGNEEPLSAVGWADARKKNRAMLQESSKII